MSEYQVLYRFFDNKYQLLYVGISSNFFSRVGQHLDDKHWFHLCAYSTFEHFATRTEVLKAEKRAIKAEMPLFNIVHNSKQLRGHQYIDRLKTAVESDFFIKLPETPDDRRVMIYSLQSEGKGFDKKTLQRLGVPWPPPKAWKSQLIQNGKLTK